VLPTAADGTRLRPLNQAELALQNLDIYKTPLVPSRLRSVAPSGVPLVEPMFQSREKAKSIVYLQRDKARKPRLGMADRIPAIEESPIRTPSERMERNKDAKPYEGRGVVKKLMARRREEEKEEKLAAAVNEEEYVPPQQHVSKIPPPPRASAPVLERKSSASLSAPSPMASLGVANGRMPSTMRNFKPTAGRTVGPTRRKRGRFSAMDGDEEEELAEPFGLEEIKEDQGAESVVPMFKPPPGFSFAVHPRPPLRILHFADSCI
jgi:nucleoporin NUP1